MPRKAAIKSRWTAENKRCLSVLQAHVCQRFGVDPALWSKAPTLENINQLKAWEVLRNDSTDTGNASKYLDEYHKEIAKFKVPTKFEPPHWHWLTDHYCKRIESAAGELNAKLSERPLFGTLPIGTMNALALRSSGKTITLIYVGLFNFLNAVSKLIALTLPECPGKINMTAFAADPQRIANQILNKPGIKNRFIELFETYIVNGDSMYAPRYLLSRKRAKLQLIFLRSSELFAIAHEYGHILLNHMDKGRERKSVLAEQKINSVWYAWKQEYEADVKGIELTIQAMRTYDAYIPISVFGVGIFFSAIALFDRIRDGLNTGSFELPARKKRGSHPPAYARLFYLKKIMEYSIAGKTGQECGVMLDLPYLILTMLFELTERHWKALHEEGIRPALIHQF